ncbi:glycosyltransferase family 2 protein [Weissella paramesenteroides]|uniref:Glycosyltransferase family 2 protein n=1 Tax=Weissella paramesenteroides TaxID=1249 RepID=A0ABD4XIA2_WEIPA|nr:glycosyltransferase family 2 protein [Weissella paramesenteroides]MDF8368741.1 glycosyltransferase family 2 protein [Weissella paramesenteroides]MDF8370868.1 glycosyltransferase family 2 protein [Weissella paramesenteroides]
MNTYEIDAVIVTYNPDKKLLFENISAVQNQVNKVVIVDNGSDNFKSWENEFNSTNIVLKHLNKNMGIAYAQNFGIKYAKHENVSWVLTLDQDTVLPKSYVEELLETGLSDDIGILSGRFVDRSFKMKENFIDDIEKVKDIISSGNLVNIRAWQKVGGFDNQLFIDYVDFDFNYKLQRAGYNIYRVNNVTYDHEIGEGVSESRYKTFIGLKNKYIFDHSYIRLYYINRNRIIVRSRYPEFGSPYKMIIREIINLREIFLFKPSRLKKFIFSIKGIGEGICYLLTRRFNHGIN